MESTNLDCQNKSDSKEVSEVKMTMNQGIKTRLVVVPILILIVVFTTKIVYTALTFGADFGSKNGQLFNTFCQDLDLQKKPSPSDSLDYQVCHHSLKMKNLLWINIDSLAYDQTQILSNELKGDLLYFKSKGTTYRQSGAMHESHLTGRVSTNFNGNPISNDNIIKQIRDSKQQQPLSFTGEKFPIFTLVGGLFQTSLVRSGSSNGFFRDMCDNEFESSFLSYKNPSEDIQQKGDELDPKEFQNYLETNFPKFEQDEATFERDMLKCLANGSHLDSSKQFLSQSTVYYSALVDHWNHSFSKKNSKTVFQIHFLNKFLVQLIKFYSKNFPDLAVILSSDHGGQKFNGEDNFCNHGCLSETNQAFLAISHPKLKGKGYSGDIDYIDIAPTIAQILEGVNIPIQSQGKVASVQKGQFKWEILALYLRYVQIKDFFVKYAQINQSEPTTLDNKDCQNLKSKYQDVLAKDNNQSLYENEKQSIINEFEQCVQIMNKEKDRIEFSMIDLASIHILEIIILILISAIIIANYKKIRAAYQEYSQLNKIVFALSILILFSDNLTVAVIKDNENPFFRINQFVYIFLLVILFCVLCFKSTQQTTSFFTLKQQLSMIRFSTIVKSNRIQRFIEKRISLILCFVLYFCHYLVCQYFIENDTILVVLQQHLEEKAKSQFLTYFNYLVFIGFYFFPKFQNLKINWIQKIFYIALFLKMLMYDLQDLRFLVKKTFEQTTDVIMISIMIGVFFIFNNLRAYSLFLEKRLSKGGSDSSQDLSKNFFTSTLIDLTIFVFFIADDIERLFLIILYLPVITISRKLLEILKLIHKTRTTSGEKEKSLKKFVSAVLVLAILFQCIHSTFLAFKGTLSLDVNIKSGNKTIGAHQEEYPFYTAIVFGINKVMIPIFFFFDISEMLLSIDPNAKRLQISQISLGVIGIMFIKQLLSDYQLLVDMFSGSMFFGMFIWTTITGVFLVQLVPYSIFCGVDYIQYTLIRIMQWILSHFTEKEQLLLINESSFEINQNL